MLPRGGEWAKKLNRKKQSRKETKDKKVISIYDYDGSEFRNAAADDMWDGYFAEDMSSDEVQHKFLGLSPTRFAFLQYLEENGTLDYPEQLFEYMDWLFTDFNRFKPEYREFLEIQDLKYEYQKIKGFKTYLDKYPDSLLVKYAYTVATIDTSNVNDVDKISSLCEEAKKAWAKVGFPPYLDMEHQDKLDIICFTTHFYQVQGMYGHALDLIQYIDSKNLTENPPRFEWMMFFSFILQ